MAGKGILGLSTAEATLLWYRLEAKTRYNYLTAKRSYQTYCQIHQLEPWPATTRNLECWVALRAYGSKLPRQHQISFKTIRSYLSALRSIHINNNWPPKVFENKRLRRIIQGAAHIFPHLKKNRFPITKDILQKIIIPRPHSLADLNHNTVFIVAWAGFLRSGEFTYTAQALEDPIFIQTHLTRSNITFEENYQYAILRLKFSKTDYDHTGVEIVLAATGDTLCPVGALKELFALDPMPPQAPLFSLQGKPYTRKALINRLYLRLKNNNLSNKGFSGYSFRKGAAQHASENGMFGEKIQKLGRWSLEAFKLYYKDSVKQLYSLSLRFQRGRAHRV